MVLACGSLPVAGSMAAERRARKRAWPVAACRGGPMLDSGYRGVGRMEDE